MRCINAETLVVISFVLGFAIGLMVEMAWRKIFQAVPVADSEGGGRKGRSPPPLKSAKKKEKVF